MNSNINLISFIKKINDDLNKTITKEQDFHEGNEISELHTHKILFIVYGAFYEKFNKEIFEPNFQAWKYGPVEIDYRKFIKDNDEKNLNKFDCEINNNEKIYLEKLIIKLLKFSPWSLVEYTHSLDAWINNYEGEEIDYKRIPKEDIFKSFENRNFD